MTEHRLFTPSQMLPFTLILGLALASQQAAVRRRGREQVPTLGRESPAHT